MKNSYSMFQAFLLICFCAVDCISAIDTIRASQSVHDPQTLLSNGKKFKLGFFSPVNSSYRYVGVMYNVPVMTVIWVANRENPIGDSNGTMHISGDGNLVVLDGRKEIVWSSNVSTPVINSSAVLLDTGNLVLQDNSDNSSRVIWESFRHASDSLVEKMKILTDLNTNEKNILTSWRSPSDPSPGNFTSTIEPLDIPQAFVWKDGYPYWRSGQWNGQIFIGLPNMKSFNKRGLDLINDNPGNAYLTLILLNSSVPFYCVLNSSGILEEKWWADEKEDWVVTWWSIYNQCDVYGKCGPFGSCNAQDRPICSCLPGFVPRNMDEWSAAKWATGCKRKTQLQCDKNNSAGELGKPDGFLKVDRVKLPDNGKSFSLVEEECRSQCLNNCSCIAYSYTAGIGCLMWAENLIDVRKLANGVADLYIRLANSDLGNKKVHKMIISTAVVLGFIIITSCAYFLLKYRAGRKQKTELILSRAENTDTVYSEESTLKHNVHGVGVEDLLLFKFQMLSNAANNFGPMNKLGQGGFGPVYKGKLPNEQEIAVKRLARSSNQGLEEFVNEVEVISMLQHRNLVKLLGCCVDSEEKMLVYEYMPNGSLDAYLFDSHMQKLLDWQTRMRIIEGICRGLLYLHRDSRSRIIHRDLKASNILLDEELNPKISDFGMARIFGGKEDHANTSRVVGTFGYMAPEYVMHGIFSEKSDVYSFGVLILEILSGRRNTSFYHEEEQLYLVSYVWKLWNEENITNLMDPGVNDPAMEIDILRYANVGLLCVQDISADRPSISTVLSMLNCEITELPHPKQPSFFGIRRSAEKECFHKNSSKCSANNVTVTSVEGR